MYLWNTKALARELRDGTLSEGEKFKYLLVYVVLITFGLEGYRYLTPDYSLSAALVSIFNILAAIVGIYICYKTNQRGDGVRFIERYICLSLPLSIKIVVIFLAAYLLFSILFTVIMTIVAPEFDGTMVLYLLGTLVGILITILFYWRLNVHIKSISHNDVPAVPA